MEKAIWYSKQIMRTLEGGEKYCSFLTAMRDFKDRKINATEAVARIQELLDGHHALLHGLKFFLFQEPDISFKTAPDYSSLQPKQSGGGAGDGDDHHHPKDSNVGRRDADYVSKGVSTSQPITGEANHEGSPPRRQFGDDEVSQVREVKEFVYRVRKRFRDDNGAYKQFLDLIGRDKEEGSSQVDEEIMRLFQNCPEFYIDFTRFQADCYTTVGAKRHRREGGTPFRRRIKQNPYEEMMFDCEDSQMEIDLLLRRLESARNKMMTFHQVVTETGVPIDIDRYFTPMDLRCVEQLYSCKDEDGGYGLEVIDLLRKYPMKTSGRLLNRLTQKFEEAGEFHCKLNRDLAKVYRDCHEKMVRKQQRSTTPADQSVAAEL